jgi:zinc/manganese transport system substrate-binding protein
LYYNSLDRKTPEDYVTFPKITRAGLALLAAALLFSCSPAASKPQGKAKTIVVTYSILGSLVSDLVGDGATVKVLIPNGLDVHEWEPSARDMEALMKADLLVVNGLGLEAGLGKSLERAREKGIPVFTASDQVKVRIVGEGEGIPSGDPDQAVGAKDPHIWTDPLAMKAFVLGLAPRVKEVLGLDVSARAASMAADLDALDAEIATMVATLPAARRKIVTGHESLGYFAARYGFRLVGALVPSLSSEAEASASWLASLKGLIGKEGLPAIFTEVGSPPRVAEALASEAGVKAIPLATHLLPPQGGYADFERTLAQTIVKGLQ